MYKIYCGDSLSVLSTIKENSIDMCITSPPYFNLRDYGTDGELGRESTVEEYLNNLLNVFDAVKLVLKDCGSLWVNLGDVYLNNSLACIPDRFKIKMVERGWICRNEIIWHKPNAMPSSVKTRFNNDYEKVFFFTKSKEYYFETQYEPFISKVPKVSRGNHQSTKYLSTEQETSVRQGMNKARGSKVVEVRRNLPPQETFVEFLRSRVNIHTLVENSSISKSTIEHWFRRDKGGFAYPKVEDWNSIKWLIDDFSEEFRDIDFRLTDVSYETDDILKNADKGRIKRAVWSIPTKAFKGTHFAPYPEKLVETPIKACCPIDGVVLDPFMGSGTTGVVAEQLGVNFLGIDINQKYCDIATQRIEDTKTEDKGK